MKRTIFQTLVVLGLGLGAGLGFTPGALAGASAGTLPGVLESYLVVQESLAADSIDGIRKPAHAIAKAVGQAGTSVDREWATQVRGAAVRLAEAKTIGEARDQFKRLSVFIVPWAAGSRPGDVEVAYCPMAGAKWLQKKGAIRNPYYGKEMLECGEKSS